jgi:hypothetical protein
MMGTMMGGYGGRMGMMQSQMSRMAMEMGGSSMGGMGIGTTRERAKGKDVRNVDRAKERKESVKKLDKTKGPTLFDPYFDIVQVSVYGQARFFNPPPAEEAQPSLGDTAAAKDATTATTPTAPAAATPPGAGEAAEKKAESADAKDKEAPKATSAPAAAAKTGAEPAAKSANEAPKSEPPTKESKIEPPKSDAPKADAKTAAPPPKS